MWKYVVNMEGKHHVAKYEFHIIKWKTRNDLYDHRYELCYPLYLSLRSFPLLLLLHRTLLFLQGFQYAFRRAYSLRVIVLLRQIIAPNHKVLQSDKLSCFLNYKNLELLHTSGSEIAHSTFFKHINVKELCIQYIYVESGETLTNKSKWTWRQKRWIHKELFSK